MHPIDTSKGKLSEKALFRQGKSNKKDDTKITTYKIKLHVEPGFGNPGAFVIENNHKHRFFLQSATLETPDKKAIHFDCRSWVYPIRKTKTSRVFFSNTCYLPSQTPEALVELRKEELESLRGDGTGERQEWDRIYDYDVYDDLGNPDKGSDYVRPVLGGSASHPYPRRVRTGRPASKNEAINLDTFVPPDERFSPKKLSEFIANAIQATAHFLLHEAKSLSCDSGSFESFDEIRNLYSENRSQVMKGQVTEKMKKLVPTEVLKQATHVRKEDHIKFPLPQIIRENEWAWREDEEFGHQMLAGTNPMRIRSLKVNPPPYYWEMMRFLKYLVIISLRFQEFPPRGSSIKISHIEQNLDGLSLEQVLQSIELSSTQ